MLIFITSQNVWIEICHYCYHHCHCNIWLNFYRKQDLRNCYIFLVSTNYIDRESDLISVYFLLISSMFSLFFLVRYFHLRVWVLFSLLFSVISPPLPPSPTTLVLLYWLVVEMLVQWIDRSGWWFRVLPPPHQFFMIM